MKKLSALFLALIMIVTMGLSSTTALAVETATAAVITNERGGSAEIAATDADALLAIIAAAKKAEASDGLSTTGTLALDTRTFDILADADGGLFLRENGATLKVDAAKLLSLLNKYANSLYPARPIPTATIGGTVLPVVKSAYAYRRLNDKFVRTTVAKTPAVSLGGSKLTLPVFSVKPQSVSVLVQKDGKTLYSGGEDKAKAFAIDEKGTYTVQITAAFAGDGVKGNVTYMYSLSHGADVRFSIENASTYAGEPVILRAQNIPEGETIAATTNLDFSPKFFREANGDYIALLPVSIFSPAGDYNVTLSCKDKSESFAIKVNPKQFDTQKLTVGKSTAEETILSQEANDEYAEIIGPLKTVMEPRQLWSGKFKMPVSDSKITTTFGLIRYVNGSTSGTVHGALDLAVPRGTTVPASNSGKVLYAGYLKLTGNTVLIEHGYGLKSWYYHMDSLTVATGDMVAQGQQIGTVGSTGFSTGPHLHFQMTINNLSINPYTATNTELFDF